MRCDVVVTASESTCQPSSRQMWANEVIPERWAPVVQSCRNMYHDWQYILWTDSSMRDFVQAHYPHFLSQYDGYPYNIQRADVFRYLVLLKYGGVYIDLDVGCVKRLVCVFFVHAE